MKSDEIIVLQNGHEMNLVNMVDNKIGSKYVKYNDFKTKCRIMKEQSPKLCCESAEIIKTLKCTNGSDIEFLLFKLSSIIKKFKGKTLKWACWSVSDKFNVKLEDHNKFLMERNKK